MVKLVITRHGESQANRDNVYTGWSDVPLTAKGIKQAQMAAQRIKNLNIHFSDVHTSMLQRAITTANLICDEIDQSYLPIHKTWRLNERHYGALRGMNKDDSKQQFGVEQVAKWRRGYSEVPPQLSKRDHERRYDRLGVQIPLSESLKMTQERLLPYWNDVIAGQLIDGQNQLIVAHGSSLRALIKYLDQIPDDQINLVEVPNGQPIVYELDSKLNVIEKQILE
ncbi:2,3-bisphosphoglycerate-dependent phosphoglycerate mutase [Paucilactobacillus nenjiangensis]|uniref:2,3-bisphosphoglycerate-dependent phosphoglycerate mutase n=2 Tax=Paucilactobacillus nenjiangensis TaxID=1296540 RepID=A0A5P1X6Z0_9LACO|nr:2,3-diphosphoglycerate-dependent phosphoglycerate mutase [Paucilactobacillus nenjiangensis]QER68038.1 2,3-diphosphoglycerate-dependent phosphoglycerate mutase [Paucilactobacillus nenjiangensis]